MKRLCDLEELAGKHEDLQALQELFLRVDSLKEKEEALRVKCQEELAELERSIASLDESLSLTSAALSTDSISEEDRRVLEMEEAHRLQALKHAKVRTLLAEANLQVSNALRVIDEVPTRTELIQYERRFEELYKQVRSSFSSSPVSRPYHATYERWDGN